MSTYPGGKGGDGVYQTIINLMPPHKIYIEPFLGAGAIMRAKRPAPVSSIGVDIDTAPIGIFHEKLAWGVRPLYLINEDGIEFLSKCDYCNNPDTLVYCDPPYLMETRKSKRPLYRFEMTTDQHIKLLNVIMDIKCMVMISGYYSDLYAKTLSEWRTATFQAQTRSGRTATEWVWMNFDVPLELHDYRYLGGNFRERERIKRKQTRWKNRLESMTDQERYAMLSVLQNLRSSAGNTAESGDASYHVNL